MDSDQGKLFIGGISWETSEEKLKEYFQGYGDVLQTVVMRDKITGKPRGFGFVVFADPNILDRVLQDTHVIDGRTVEAKRALSREEQQQGSKSGNMSSGRSFGGGGNNRTKKIFVGGLPPTLTEDGFRTYFETYGNITDVAIMYDQQTNRPRGFGFISFDSEDAVDRVLHKTYHDVSGKQVEVKRALPKDSNSGFGGRSMGDNPSSYDRMDTNRYMQSQNTGGGGYPPYGSSGYGGAHPGYGYGSSNNGMGGYGGYGSYGGAINPGYGGPAVAAFGNPNVPAGGPRSSWGSQGPSGYGNMGYGGGGPANGGSSAGQTPTGATGYGNQGYGYGGYGGSDSAYGGGASGDMQSGAGGYMGGGYGDAIGNSGYGNSTLRSDTSQGSGNYGAQVGYGGGYGGAPSRQAQQH
ncbi:heterogeneous nuclear ribonucleoprotein 1-like [Lycium ferocissimum]|uniref:heterogeneous nuclear ribonucleoprotein 1-like n=1 Tax=Lycium ferocissimum TaxID=112874 RepID=UPI002814B5A5|nr:heterogeneous nuclear ribonucleoprotein 1-like [Lycium ferocissimum]